VVLVISFITAAQSSGLVLAAVPYALLTAAPLLLQKKGQCVEKGPMPKTRPTPPKAIKTFLCIAKCHQKLDNIQHILTQHDADALQLAGN